MDRQPVVDVPVVMISGGIATFPARRDERQTTSGRHDPWRDRNQPRGMAKAAWSVTGDTASDFMIPGGIFGD